MSEIDHAALYRSIRLRITELVSAAPDEALDRPAPATPSWRVRDVVAHLAGATADAVSGNLEGVASDPWTQAQVDARRDTPIDEVLAEWSRCSELVEPTIGSIPPPMRTMLLTDAVTHEHDIRGALGAPGERESDAVAFSFGGVTRGIGAQRQAAGAGPLRIVHEAGERLVGGEGEPTATVRTSRFEVVRAAVGRRSAEQIAAWDWDGDPDPTGIVLDRFAPARPTPLVE
jgi:uncharacterized protein (TIGR03083 family)